MATDPTHNPNQGADLATTAQHLATTPKAVEVQQPLPPPPALKVKPPLLARSPAIFGSTLSVRNQGANTEQRLAQFVGNKRENTVKLKEIVSSRDHLEPMQFKGGLSEKFAAARDKGSERER